MTKTYRRAWLISCLTFTPTRITFTCLPDQELWEYARREGFLIVTKDADFSDLLMLLGFPPKVIWIRRGNCRTADIEMILRDHYAEIEALNEDNVIGVLTLF